MRVRIGLLLAVFLALAVFAALNWSLFTASTDIDLLFARVVAPLGIIMLGVVVGVTLLCVAFLLWLETSALLEARRHARELDAQRELAQNAEASRYSELKDFLSTELSALRTIPEATARDVMARLEGVRTELRDDIERAGNTVAAYVGELEERLARADHSASPSTRTSP